MAKIANSEASSDEAGSISSTEAEDERMDDCGGGDDNLDEEDEEELEAVARTAAPGDDGDDAGEDQSTEDDEVRGSGGGTDEEEGEDDDAPGNAEIGKRERARLREMQRLKKQKIQEILDAQNASIDADMNNKGKGRLNYLLQQTEIFAHFAKGDQSARVKRPGARGRHASKVTEEEEDEEYLKEEEEALSGAGGTRLVTQPSCIQGKMRDYQLAGLNWLIRLYENGINGILADEMGLGKTLQTISLLGYLHEFRGITGPHMVVAPKSTLGNWMNEIRRFCPILRAVKFLGNPDERNNLHELWSLLNFLLPEIFSSAETFDEWFQISGENDQQEVVQQLHKVLRPFLLRRLKSDVEKGLPPKKETILKVGMSQMQKQYYRALLQKDLEVVNAGGERKRLLNIAMQLRKCCNHPYLFQGKMVLLDKLLPKLKERDSRVLIFSQYTIEEKVIERAYKKLALDALVIQQGRLAEQKTVNKDELLQMVRFGAEMVFSSKDSTITDEDIDRIIAKGEEATAELDAKMKKFTEDAIKFKMDDTAELYDFDDEKGDSKVDFKKLVSDNWIEPPKRERKRKHDFQFFNTQRLSELYEKEVRYLMQTHQQNQLRDTIGDGDEPEEYDRIVKNIERGEARISRKDEIMKAIGKKLDRYKNPWLELKIQYGQNKGKLYNEECDRFMLCMVHKLGYGNWDELKAAFRTSALFRFDWFVKSRTTQELARRCDTLIRLVEKENQEYDERERQARKDKKHAKVGFFV
ncbi:putative chromatin-remodeling complex ATPase chain [Acorus calamus]|uniref:Chromatin-remodeling complex ATPase chain n=1 Tax=Acorus calamus TaxID=4465 RepID=A0AAV9CU59_ACOCL|nr:putative chromatin-remodeling complex ATPase chain [Acorus calamus]